MRPEKLEGKLNSRYFFRLNTQFDNLGDALINRELVGLLSEMGIVTIDISAAPDKFIERVASPEVDSAQGRSGLSFWSALLFAGIASRFGGPSAWLVLNPGGHAGEISTSAALRRLASLMVLAGLRILGVKVAGVGLSYEELGRKRALVTRAHARLMTVHAVRDNGSMETCRALGIKTSAKVPDLAFALSPLPYPDSQSDVVLSFRAVAGGHMSRTSALASALIGRKVIAAWQVERDEPEMMSIAQELSSRGVAVETAPLTSNIAANRAFYGSAEAVVSNRLHVLLLAMSSGGLPIAMLSPGEQHKIAGIYRDIGLSELLVAPGALASLLSSPDEMKRLRQLCSIRFAEQSAVLRQQIRRLLGDQTWK